MKLCEFDQCTGCGVCAACCPRNAISMVRGRDGFKHPVVENDKCIDCALCAKTCPQMNAKEKNLPRHTYAAYSLDSKTHKSSASGGVATAFGQAIVQKNGIVFGAVLKDNGYVCFESAQSENELCKFQNSKYVESDAFEAYKEVKCFLRQGKLILFGGLPCQIAGLLNYIPQELQSNLYTADLICHGTPPDSLLIEHIKRTYGKDAQLLSFRNENAEFFLKIKKNDKIYNIPGAADTYYKAFIDGYTYKASCYTCPYAQIARIGDVTIGDFWGIGKDIPYPHDKKKVSLVLENTTKGAEMLSWVKSNLQLDERTLQEALERNEQLHRPSAASKKRELYTNYTEQMNTYKAMKKLSAKEAKYQEIRYQISCLKKYLLQIVK